MKICCFSLPPQLLEKNMKKKTKAHLKCVSVQRRTKEQLTYDLQQTDVFSQGAHAATEGDDEHEDPNHHQHHSWVH